MSGTNRGAILLARRLAVATLLLSVNISSPSAVAEDLANASHLSPDIFSKVMSDLDTIKETAFADPFLDAAAQDNSQKTVSNDCQDCDRGAKVCPHLAHPQTQTNLTKPTTPLAAAKLSVTADSKNPLACSYEVRCTDVIPPVPNIEDYATPDAFVDEDMIDKLQLDTFTMNVGFDNYCDQMAKLLSDTLSSDSLSQPQKTAAIKSAMRLAVINAQIAAEAKIAQVKAAHESELAIMRGRLLQYSYIESNQQKLYQWLSPIYSNVNRNFQQIAKMDESTTQLKRCLDIIQSQLNTGQTASRKNQLIVTKRGQHSSRPMTVKSSVQRVPNQFVQGDMEEIGSDQITTADFQILERRLQNAESFIQALTSYRAESQSRPQEYPQGQEANALHQRVSYDRLTPIAPLQPRR